MSARDAISARRRNAEQSGKRGNSPLTLILIVTEDMQSTSVQCGEG
jgi:hypothetical protein